MAIIMESGNSLQLESLPVEMAESKHHSFSTEIPVMPLAEMEIIMIKKALLQTGGNKSQAVELLGIDASTLWRKMKKLWGRGINLGSRNG